jgi:hypothetical protein
VATLVSRWTLAETSGTRADAVVASANDLSENGGAISRVTGPNGNVPWAVQLTGANYLSRANASLSAGFPGAIATADVSMSFGCWVNPAALGTQQGIFNRGDGWFMYLGADSTVKVSGYTDGYASFPTISSGALTNGVWYHVVGVWDLSGTTLTMYFNGASAGSAAMATMNQTDSGAALFIGNANLGGSPILTGSVAEPFVFTGALTSGEVSSIYTGGLPAFLSPGGPWPTLKHRLLLGVG